MAFTDRIYNIDWNKLVTQLIPSELCKSKLLAFVNALVMAVVNLFNDFTAYKNYTVYWLGINSQVCFMQKALNDKYDISLRRIRIVDGVEYDAVPFYLKAENKPVKFYKKGEGPPVILYTKAETAMFTADFIVEVPTGLVFNMKEMRAFIDTFRTPAKTYIIQYV
jgi:hypothetical protein